MISNVRNGADTIEAGQFIDNNPFDEATTADLVAAGVIAEVVGAKDIEDAMNIIAENEALAKEEAEVVAASAPKNTWGPQSDEEAGKAAIEAANNDAAPTEPTTEVTTPATTDATEPTTTGPVAPEETGENL